MQTKSVKNIKKLGESLLHISFQTTNYWTWETKCTHEHWTTKLIKKKKMMESEWLNRKRKDKQVVRGLSSSMVESVSPFCQLLYMTGCCIYCWHPHHEWEIPPMTENEANSPIKNMLLYQYPIEALSLLLVWCRVRWMRMQIIIH